MKIHNRLTPYRSGSVISLVVLLCAGCNSRSPVDGATGSIPTSPEPTSASPVFSLALNPPAMIGGAAGSGRVTLSAPAPAAGTTIVLSSSDPIATVPRSVTVPAGALTSDFSVVSQQVSSDRRVAIGGSASGRSAAAALSLWTLLPTFFSFASEPADPVGRGESGRFTTENAAIRASCQASWVFISVDPTIPGFWTAEFGAPTGTPMTVGTYENAVAVASCALCGGQTSPYIHISGSGGCSGTGGRFVVHEVEVTAKGSVRKFWATFEQRCPGSAALLRGDVRVTNPPGSESVSACTVP